MFLHLSFFFGGGGFISWHVKFPGQGSNLCHSSNLSHCSDNARSLTCSGVPGIFKKLLFWKISNMNKRRNELPYTPFPSFRNSRYVASLVSQSCLFPPPPAFFWWSILFYFILFFFFFLGPHPQHMEVPRLGDRIGAVAVGLHHSQDNARPEPRLQLTPQLTATLDAWPTEQGQGPNPHSYGYKSAS